MHLEKISNLMTMVQHSKPTIGQEEADAVVRVLTSLRISDGSTVTEFEREMATFTGVRFARATSSGTTALHLALAGLRVDNEWSVVLPTYCCSAVLNAVRYVRARPVFLDVDEEGNIDLKAVQDTVHRLAGLGNVVVVIAHMFGRPVSVDVPSRLGFKFVEDCAMAIGGTIKLPGEQEERKLGSIGTVGVVSFYATKMMTTGQGGMVLTNDQECMERVRDLSQYDNREDYDVRYNYSMTDMQAAIGRVQLGRLNDFIAVRRHLALLYKQRLSDLPVDLPSEPRLGKHIYHRFVIRLRDRTAEEASAFLRKRGIEAKRPVYMPLHKYFGEDSSRFPMAEHLHRCALSLPIYPSLSEDEVEKVCDAVRDFFKT